MGEIQVKGVVRVSLIRSQDFNKEGMWDLEDQRVAMGSKVVNSKI